MLIYEENMNSLISRIWFIFSLHLLKHNLYAGIQKICRIQHILHPSIGIKKPWIPLQFNMYLFNIFYGDLIILSNQVPMYRRGLDPCYWLSLCLDLKNMPSSPKWLISRNKTEFPLLFSRSIILWPKPMALWWYNENTMSAFWVRPRQRQIKWYFAH